MTTLSTRPERPVVGTADAARERRAARHRPRAVHRRSGQPAPQRAPRPPGAGPAHPCPGDGAAHRACAAGARHRRGAHRRGRAGSQRRRGRARRAAVPGRGDVPRGTPCAGCSPSRWRRPGWAPLAVEVDYEPLPALVTIAEAIAAESFQGARPTSAARRPGGGPGPAARTSYEGEFEFAGQEHFYLETNAALATIAENGQVFVQSSDPAPERDAGDHRARPGPSRSRGHGAVPANGRRVQRQGDAAAAATRRSPRSAPASPGGRCGCG